MLGHLRRLTSDHIKHSPCIVSSSRKDLVAFLNKQLGYNSVILLTEGNTPYSSTHPRRVLGVGTLLFPAFGHSPRLRKYEPGYTPLREDNFSNDSFCTNTIVPTPDS
jgi:hypothetical protein